MRPLLGLASNSVGRAFPGAAQQIFWVDPSIQLVDAFLSLVLTRAVGKCDVDRLGLHGRVDLERALCGISADRRGELLPLQDQSVFAETLSGNRPSLNVNRRRTSRSLRID